MATPLTELLAELDRLLEPARFSDYGPNGLQVPGSSEVERIATGVSASAALFERAAAARANLVIVHHGLFWGSGPISPIDPALKRRLKLLFDTDMSLAAYHLPLDAHPEVGNNAQIAYRLGADALEPFALHVGEPIGCVATFAGEGLNANELFSRVADLMDREPLVFDAGPDQVRRLAIVSGAGSDYLADATACEADAFLTGEPTERVMTHSREAGVHFIAAGHYATETFGVRLLGEHLAERFDVDHQFIDIPNPI